MLTGTAILLVLIVALLAIPVTVTYQLAWHQTFSADVRLAWAFGLVHADLSPGGATDANGEDEAAREKSDRKGKPKSRTGNVMAVIRDREVRGRITRFVLDLWRAIRKQNVRLHVRLGLGDPADTGQLWGLLGPVSGAVARLRDVRIAIEPDFLDSTLDVTSSGTVRMIPLRILTIVFGLVLSPSIWRGWKLMRTPG